MFPSVVRPEGWTEAVVDCNRVRCQITTMPSLASGVCRLVRLLHSILVGRVHKRTNPHYTRTRNCSPVTNCNTFRDEQFLNLTGYSSLGPNGFEKSGFMPSTGFTTLINLKQESQVRIPLLSYVFWIFINISAPKIPLNHPWWKISIFDICIAKALEVERRSQHNRRSDIDILGDSNWILAFACLLEV